MALARRRDRETGRQGDKETNWLTRLTSIARPTIVKELIGRWVPGGAQFSLFRSRSYVKTIDETIPNYEFWDKLRRGKAKGYSLGGLFAKRIERIFASWIIGQELGVTLAEAGDPDNEKDPRNYTDEQLSDFINENYTLLLDALANKFGLGDQYIIVNVDGSLSVPSPDTLTCRRNPLDYRTVEAWVITTRLDEYTITDEYRLDGRTITVKQADKIISVQNFDNLIDRIPVVHLAHGMSGNEVYGHPIHEELKPLYDQYDDLIYKQLDGAKLLGNPLLAFVGMEDIGAVQNANQPAETSTYTDKDGNTANRPQLNIDSNAVLLVGKGGDAKFVAPPTGFTEDTKTALKSLFLLLLDHTGIPEFIWGNELSGSHATAQVQMQQWVLDIKAMRKHEERWLLELCDIWLATAKLTDSKLVVDRLEVDWPELLEGDKEVLLKYIDFAKLNALIQDTTALDLLDLVDDPTTEVKKAQTEADKKQQAMMDTETADFGQRLKIEAKTQPAAELALSAANGTVRTDVTVIAAVRELRASLL